jgi:hypothetical protein
MSIDAGWDEEGMEDIANLHGGGMNGIVAKSEFNEMKAKVIAEVRHLLVVHLFNENSAFHSASQRTNHTERYRGNIKDAQLMSSGVLLFRSTINYIYRRDQWWAFI